MHALTAVVHTLGPDPEAMLKSLGAVAFWVALAIIFAECGLLIGFFLPGDSLLFIVGMLIAQGFIAVNIGVAVLLLILVAILGNIALNSGRNPWQYCRILDRNESRASPIQTP
jgi:membrane-associated protein